MKLSKNKWADHYTERARKENFAARSVYKLAEIQKKHRLIARGNTVLDLGCAPGSWLQFAAQETGPQGRVVGVDLQPVKVAMPAHVNVIQGDIYDLSPEADRAMAGAFDVVLSDMAPFTTGNKFSDGVRSYELCRAALSVAERVLKPGGHFVCKIFQGEDFKSFCDQVKAGFNQMRIFKPQSSRKASREIFIIGLERK